MVPSPNGGADREHKIVRPMIDIYQKMSEKYSPDIFMSPP